MAHFYGELRGNRGTTTRQGSKDSGIWVHIRGWNVGIEVLCKYDKNLKADVCIVYKTGGSSQRSSNEQIAKVVEAKED